ncbi:MAG: Gfo/Idh/MocA family oxidoreductase [Sedimentisphaerales bacterium]|nr:Gfo/Idh/MocA family oxidoreductase [Sedimentisphaerales bacterium]
MKRREFLKGAIATTAGIVGFPYLVSPSAMGTSGTVSPSNRITLGCIGVGRMGVGDMRSFMSLREVQVVAVCDVDSKRLNYAKQIVETHYGEQGDKDRYKGCAAYGDFREVIEQKDIDAVSIVTPDHWHALPALAAAQAGKDIFLQKPLTLTIQEGRLLSDTVRRNQRILLVGTQHRSNSYNRHVCELVRNGRIGKLHTVRIGLWGDPACPPQPNMPAPENLDYQMWLGPSPEAPYTEKRVHPQEDYSRPGWLRIDDYCCGQITGNGSHYLDMAHWAMDTERTGPLEIQGETTYPTEGIWDVHEAFHLEYTYANGVRMIVGRNCESGVRFEGSDGWVTALGPKEAEPKSLLSSVIGANEIHLEKSDNHKQHFIDCIKSRREPIAPVEVGHRSPSACILGYMAMKLGQKLRWDPKEERCTNNHQANRMLSRPLRSPWQL